MLKMFSCGYSAAQRGLWVCILKGCEWVARMQIIASKFYRSRPPAASWPRGCLASCPAGLLISVHSDTNCIAVRARQKLFVREFVLAVKFFMFLFLHFVFCFFVCCFCFCVCQQNKGPKCRPPLSQAVATWLLANNCAAQHINISIFLGLPTKSNTRRDEANEI